MARDSEALAANRCAVPAPKPLDVRRSSDRTRLLKRIDQMQREHGLGRLCAPDKNDAKFPMRALMPRDLAAPRTKIWSMFTKPLDQGLTSECVAYSWLHFLLAAPTVNRVNQLGMPIAEFTRTLYDEAKTLDEWPGTNYDGTSVRAGAKALVKRRRLATGYAWAYSANTMRDFVVNIGPVVVGTWWYDRMFAVDADGFLRIEGEIAGGHAYLIIGYDVKRDAFRVVNSWGTAWGVNGRAWLRFADAERLIAEDGEACAAVEIDPKP
jgi:hypothetical protein